jgi:hypothetical protein
VRRTSTLDEDVAARLKAEVRRAGKPVRTVVNEYLRLGMSSRVGGGPGVPPFVIRRRDLGAFRTGLGLDNIGDLLEAAEGPLHR